jgi:hypothetical protein
VATAVDVVLRVRREGQAALSGLVNELGGLGTLVARLTSGTTGLTSAAAGLAAVGAAAFVAARQLGNAAEQLGRVQATTGQGTSDLQVYASIVRDAGGDVDQFNQALGYFNTQVGQANPMLRQLGITTRDTSVAFKQLVEIVRGIESPSERARILQELLGKAGKKAAADILSIADSYDIVKARMERSGELVSEVDILRAQILDAKFDHLGHTWEGAMTRAKVASIPLAQFVADLLDKVQQFGPLLGSIATFLPDRATAEANKALGLLSAHGFPSRPTDKDADTGPETPRQRQIREIIRLLGMGKLQAEQFAASLDAIADSKKREALFKDIGVPKQRRGLEDLIAEAQAASEFELPDVRPIPPSAGSPVQVPQLLVDGARRAAQDWAEILAQMTSAGQVTGDLINAAFVGVHSSIVAVFDSLLQGVPPIVRSLVDSILVELSRLATAQLFRGILGAFGFAAAGPVGVFAGLPGLASRTATGRAESLSAAPVQNVTQHLYVSAIDAQSFTEQARSATGRQREALRRMAAPAMGWAN